MALSLNVNLKPLLASIDRNTDALQIVGTHHAAKLDAIAKAIANLSDPPPGRFIITVEEQ